MDVFGTTLPGSILEMHYDNHLGAEQSITLRTDDAGNFIATIPLSEGFNVIDVISHNSASPDPIRQLLQLTYDTSPLTLFMFINDPPDGSVLSDRVLTVSGETLPGAEVAVNDIILAEVDETGLWQANILLRLGLNEITVLATFEGKTAKNSITVRYQP